MLPPALRRLAERLAALAKTTRRSKSSFIIEALEIYLEEREDPLQGAPLSGQWKGLRRLRVSAVRVIYGFDGTELLISVLRVGHRREVYRK